MELLSDLGIDMINAKMIDDTTLRLEKNEIDILQDKVPYLIAMSVKDLAEIVYEIPEEEKNIEQLLIPEPKNEPIVGVIDTQFDKSVYFSEWVEYHKCISEDIDLQTGDFFHGTAVSSIIVDGPSFNPNLQDNCGRFRVRHFGVATAGRFSSFAILKQIRDIVRRNRDIKVWNLSLGSAMEIDSNFISPEAAELDKIQYEYDGYDKTIGDYFNLAINKEESKVVQQIYKWYTEEGYGAAKIANMLNEKGYKTKRNCKWSQNATCRILTNEIYTGKIINGKQEVSDFLTGQRRDKDETEWMVVERPELRIIEDETFEKAQEILRGRHDAFNLSHERQSNKHLFSTLIKCKECGWSFRRTVRTYKNTYVRWVCSGRNGRGVDSCPNKTVVDEEELIEVLQEYFTNVLKQKKKVIAHVVNEFQRVYKAKDENVEYEKELNAELAKLQKTRQKYMDMYTDDLISREELNEKIGGSRQEMERIENELKMVSYHLTKGEQLENILNNTFKEIEDITDVHQMTNQQLKRLIQKIEVDKEGNVDIYLRLLGDLGLDESVLIEENETVLNCDDQT